MKLTNEQLKEVRAAVRYYMNRHISINNPRYDEFEVILEKLTESINQSK